MCQPRVHTSSRPTPFNTGGFPLLEDERPGVAEQPGEPHDSPAPHTPGRSASFYRRRAARRRYFRRHPEQSGCADGAIKRGRPGSRRHRRYLNRIFAHCDIINCGQEGEEDGDDSLDQCEWHAHFQLAGYGFFHSPENEQLGVSPCSQKSSAGERFQSDVQDKQSHQLLNHLCATWLSDEADVGQVSMISLLDMLIGSVEPVSSANMYKRISKSHRRSLRQARESRFFKELEFLLVFLAYGPVTNVQEQDWNRVYNICSSKITHVDIVNDTGENRRDALMIYLSSSFHRKIVHVLSQYYNVKVNSYKDNSGRRLTCLQKCAVSNIRRSKRRPMTLSTYLLQLR